MLRAENAVWCVCVFVSVCVRARGGGWVGGRYVAQEMGPEDFAEKIKEIVDVNNVVVPLEVPVEAAAHSRNEGAEAQSEEGSHTDAATNTGSGKHHAKRPAASSETASKNKAKLVARGGGGAAERCAERAGGAVGAAGGSGRGLGAVQKKRKGSASASSSSDDQDRVAASKQAAAAKKTKGSSKGGGEREANSKVLIGTLTPVVSALEVKREGAEEEENSAWDALLSVCAQMPRHKSK
jgi:hypothetical protein